MELHVIEARFLLSNALTISVKVAKNGTCCAMTSRVDADYP